MPLRWLHIADLGFGENIIVSRRAREALPKLLEERRAADKGVDFIFVAGNVAATGTAASYHEPKATTKTAASKSLPSPGSLLAAMAASAGLTRGAIMVVPGSGDMDPEECIGLSGLKHEHEAARYFGRQKPLRHLCKLEPFIQWHDQFFSQPFPVESTCQLYPLSGGGHKLVVLRVNTTLFATQGTPNHGKLWVGRSCLQPILDALPPREQAVRMVLLHHPLDWLHHQEQIPIVKRLRSSMDIILHTRFSGVAATQQITTSHGAIVEMAAGRERTHHHAFIATLDGSSLIAEPLRYDDERERWTLEVSMFADDHDHLGHFTLGPKPPPSVSSLPASSHSTQATQPPSSKPVTISPKELSDYLNLLRERFGRLSMVGLGSARLRLSLDDVYVPLRLQAMNDWASDHDQRKSRVRDAPVDLSEALALAGQRQLFVIGQPGSGKTTALLKLLWQCVQHHLDHRGDNEDVGPDDDPPLLPIFAHIRSLDGKALATPFCDFLQCELDKQASLSKLELEPDLAARLWQRGRLLVLLDGLDEVAQTKLRADICRHIEEQSRQAAERGIRMAVSCRKSGIEGQADLSRSDFLRLEVQPLDAEHSRDLVTKWFGAAEQSLAALDRVDEQVAWEKGVLRGRQLADKLDTPEHRNKLRTILGNPLLLTQLCLVVFNGGEIPERRAEFFAECLKTLLGRWSRDRGEPPMLSTEQALKLLRPIAWKLHCAERKYDLSINEVREAIGKILRRLEDDLRRPLPLRALLRWLHHTTGVLHEYASEEYGFSHLHFQEYLAAEQGSRLGATGVARLATHFSEEWWEEVVQLYVAIDDRGGFSQLMRCVLPTDALTQRTTLLRNCLQIANEVEVAPFLELALNPQQPPARRAALLGLVADRSDPEVVRAAATIMTQLSNPLALNAPLHPDIGTQIALSGTAHSAATETLRAIAEQIETRPASERSDEDERAFDIFLSHNSRDKPIIRQLYRRLRQHNIRAWLDEQELPPGREWQSLLEQAIATTKTAAVLVGPSGLGPWEEPEMRACLAEFVRRQMPVIPILLPDAPATIKFPLFLRSFTYVDMRDGIHDAQLSQLIWGITGEKPATLTSENIPQLNTPSKLHAFVDKTTGIHFLWVPPGSFMMGGEAYEDEQPIHRVELSGFWLAETPVTNRQYGVYLEAAQAQEPDYWRNREFNGPEQPVVGVSWHDTKAFCSWLARESKRRVVLPSEAQWEYAARGPSSSLYPWGDEKPNPTRACYDASSHGATAPVGSYPQGRGPFGTLDQAGNVWEWCEDVWDDAAYRWPHREQHDPIRRLTGDENDNEASRVLRGGSWFSPAMFLRAAVRVDLGPGFRGDFGFRVAVLP